MRLMAAGPEGPSYWEYATLCGSAIAALEEAGLDSRDLGASPGLASTWRFGKDLIGPSGLAFDSGDNLPLNDRCPALGWLAARSGDPEAAAWQRLAPGLRHPFDLIWHAPAVSPKLTPEPASVFAKAGIATLRDAQAASGFFVAVKGGDNSVNHAHLDLGTFVLEAKGERFVSDLGRDDYALPGYFTADRRFTYLRTGTLAHNTIVIEGRNQSVSASATPPVLRSDPDSSAVALGINDPDSPCIIRRAVALSPGSHVAIVDHIARAVPARGDSLLAYSHQGRACRAMSHVAARRERIEAPACCAFPCKLRERGRPHASRRGRQQCLHTRAGAVRGTSRRHADGRDFPVGCTGRRPSRAATASAARLARSDGRRRHGRRRTALTV